MKSNMTELFNRLCEEHSSFFESWKITETRDSFYMQITPVGSVAVCCGGKKKSAYENRLDIQSLIDYAIRYSKKSRETE